MGETHDVKWWINALKPILDGSKYEAKIETVQSGDYVGIAPKAEYKKSEKKKEQYLCVKPYKDGGYSTWMIKQVWEGSPLYGSCKPTRENAAKMPHFNDMEDPEFVLQIVKSFANTTGITYWPPLDVYNPGITVEMWKAVLNDSSITTADTLFMLQKMLELGGESTCAHLSEIYGNTPAHYNGIGRAFGQRVKDKYNCPDCIDTDDVSEDRNRVSVIPFVGRDVKENGNKRYSWKLRDELKEALKAMAIAKEEYILTITADSVTSTDPTFTMDNLGLGDKFKPLDVWFEDAKGTKTIRKRAKREQKISNQTLPKLACQIFEAQLSALTPEEKFEYITCQYEPKGKIHKGIYPSIDEYKSHHNSLEFMVYTCVDGSKFVIYSWNIFSTVIFVKETLSRFGAAGDKFILTYRSKTEEDDGDDNSDDNSDEELDVIDSGVGYTHNLNTVLYGPPGTGKTYHTVIYAVAIIESKSTEEIASEDYDVILNRYNEYKRQGKIAFTTFHQSYGYEEFIEGIKPVVDTEEDDGKSDIQYAVSSGIFKNFCEKAVRNKSIRKVADYGLNESPNIWKVSLEGTGDNPTRAECLNNDHIRIGWDAYGKDITDETDFSTDGGKKPINAFINRMRIGDVVLSCYSATTIDAIGVITGDYEWHDEYTHYKRLRKVNWIVKNVKENIMDITDGTTMTLSSVYRLANITLDDVLKIVEKYNVEEVASADANDNYVFIIDEINRGNISKIFGELITLIEPSKRVGADEEMTAILPYSAKPFGVPNNVYIIGTMNTADRSIATIDTALRRRFYFKEMLPRPSVLEDVYVDDVSISALLDLINKRISVLYDREHTIGHAYFMPLKKDNSIETLAKIFENNIIPLLQEYFYEDYEKIRLVLGDSKKHNEKIEFIVANPNEYAELFGDIDVGLDEGFTYEINKDALKDIEAYRSI